MWILSPSWRAYSVDERVMTVRQLLDRGPSRTDPLVSILNDILSIRRSTIKIRNGIFESLSMSQ